jgi:hypothetical protein
MGYVFHPALFHLVPGLILSWADLLQERLHFQVNGFPSVLESVVVEDLECHSGEHTLRSHFINGMM